MTDFRQIGPTIICPHSDGDYTLQVFDLEMWATGMCLVKQEGQLQTHELCLRRKEAADLAILLMAFSEGA